MYYKKIQHTLQEIRQGEIEDVSYLIKEATDPVRVTGRAKKWFDRECYQTRQAVLRKL